MITVYGIKNCDSVKKALRFLQEHSIPYRFHDMKSDPLNAEIVREWNRYVSVDTLLNTKGTTYRTLDLKNKSLDEEDKITWMGQHNLLIKRPVIEMDHKLIVGFNQSQYEGIFLP